MTLDLWVGLLGVAIAIGQIVVDKPDSRTKVIAASTLVLACGMVIWFLGSFLFEKVRIHQNADLVTKTLSRGPATYQDILDQGGFTLKAADQVIDYLVDEKTIQSEVEDFKVGDKTHRIRMFELSKP
jgi:hypothetical protein